MLIYFIVEIRNKSEFGTTRIFFKIRFRFGLIVDKSCSFWFCSFFGQLSSDIHKIIKYTV